MHRRLDVRPLALLSSLVDLLINRLAEWLTVICRTSELAFIQKIECCFCTLWVFVERLYRIYTSWKYRKKNKKIVCFRHIKVERLAG